jgi:hypothetical protein
MLGSGLRGLDGEALGGFRRPAQARHGLAGGFDTRTICSSKRPRCSLRRGWFPSPHVFQTAKSRRSYSGVARGQVKRE